MSNNTINEIINNTINEKKKALLAYKQKILDEIKYYERSIDDFHANHKNNIYYEEVCSSDSEDDFPHTIDTGPTIPQLKLQQAMLKTCLQATQELTSLMVLQSEINVLVDEPKFEGECPVTEPGTWKEVTAECRIDLVPFTITFYMHTPDRKFAPPSYRGLRVVPVKYAHEMELAKSVLHTLKMPSDAVEVIKSYAAGYRSRRTTLARLANKYTNSLFMEPHPEGGFVLKCADLLEVSWRLENKWSPVAPFHHRMKFDLEYMDESYIKIITQAHKQLLDPSIQTDERTLLLAKIISTCLEARGPVDPESDLESKTTERDFDTDKRDSDIEKRDSEVMAPPKSLPKKPKKTKDNLLNPGQKRSLDDENGKGSVKRMKSTDLNNDVVIQSNLDGVSNARKNKINDVPNEGAKRPKINDVSDKNANKVVSNKNVKNSGNIKDRDSNVKSKTVREAGNNEDVNNAENKDGHTASKNTKNVKETANIEDRASNTKPKNKNLKENNNMEKDSKTKPNNKNVKDSGNTEQDKQNVKLKNKITKEAGETEVKDDNTKSKNKNAKASGDTEKDKASAKLNAKDSGLEKGNAKSKVKNAKEPKNIEPVKDSNTKSKNKTIKEAGNPDNYNKDTVTQPKNIEKKKNKEVANAKSNENTDSTKNKDKVSTRDVEHPKNKITEKKNVANTNKLEAKSNKTDNKPKTIETTKTKDKNVAGPKNDEQIVKKVPANGNNQEKPVLNKGSEKTIKNKQSVNLNAENNHQIVNKITEKHANNNKIKDKISQITNKVGENNIKNNLPNIIKETVSKKVTNNNLITNTRKSKEVTNLNTNNKKLTKDLTKSIKTMSHKTSTNRNTLKVQNSQKPLKTGNSKIFSSGNTEKENGGHLNSKIPQKKLSPISESSSKKNLLRVSPRKIPSKLKSSSQENLIRHKMMKTTNIPRLMKKPAPKSIQ